MMQTGDSRPDDEVTEPYADLLASRSVELPEHMHMAAVPHPVPTLSHVVDVSAGDDSFYAVTDGEEIVVEPQEIHLDRGLDSLLNWGPFPRSNLFG